MVFMPRLRVADTAAAPTPIDGLRGSCSRASERVQRSPRNEPPPRPCSSLAKRLHGLIAPKAHPQPVLLFPFGK